MSLKAPIGGSTNGLRVPEDAAAIDLKLDIRGCRRAGGCMRGEFWRASAVGLAHGGRSWFAMVWSVELRLPRLAVYSYYLLQQ